MADYKTLHGSNIETVSSDPSNPIKGQVWYNSDSQTLKGRILSAAAWATSNAMNTARRTLAGAGIQTAALGFGGQVSSTDKVLTESYDGSSWTEVADLNTARRELGGTGTSTAALAFGGGIGGGTTDTGATEEWNVPTKTNETITTS